MRPHLPIAAGALIVAYLLFQLYRDQQWTTNAAYYGCHIIERTEGNQWASIGMTGNPQIAASSPRDKWVCADGMIYWHDRL
jgi:hypothetical protein